MSMDQYLSTDIFYAFLETKFLYITNVDENYLSVRSPKLAAIPHNYTIFQAIALFAVKN